MTIIFKDTKTILLKTYKTGSTSLHYYLYDLFKDNPEVVFTDLSIGHDTFIELHELIDFDVSDYTVVAITRYPLQYMNSVYNQFIFDKDKQAKSLKIIRLIDKISVKLGFIIFYIYFCMIHKKKTNIVNANLNLILTYPYKNLRIVNYFRINELKKYVPKFNLKDFRTYNFRKHSDRDILKVITKSFRKKIIKDFNPEIDLLTWCNYEKLYEKYS